MDMTNEPAREKLRQIEARLMEAADIAQTIVTEALDNLNTATDETRKESHSDIKAMRAKMAQLARKGLEVANKLGDTKTAERMTAILENMPEIVDFENMETADPIKTAEAIFANTTTPTAAVHAAIIREAAPLIEQQLYDAIPDTDPDNSQYHLLAIEFGDPKATTENDLGRGTMVAATISHLRESDIDELPLLLTNEAAAQELGETVAPTILALLSWGNATEIEPEEGTEPKTRRARNLMIIHPHGMETFLRLEGEPKVMHLSLKTEADAEKISNGEHGRIPQLFADFYTRAYIASGKPTE